MLKRNHPHHQTTQRHRPVSTYGNSIVSRSMNLLPSRARCPTHRLLLQIQRFRFSTNKTNTTASIISNLQKASRWVEAKQWDPTFIRSSYEAYIEALTHTHKDAVVDGQSELKSESNDRLESGNHSIEKEQEYDDSSLLFTPEVATNAAFALTRMKIPTEELSWRVRSLEKLLGENKSSIPFTYQLSLALLRANGKAGNVARTLDLLRLRGEHKFKPTHKEYEFSIQSIQSNGVKMRTSIDRVYKKDTDLAETTVDNPTKWLDAILVNMHQRGFELKSVALANQMIDTYAASGRNGRASHFFFRIRKPNDRSKENKVNMDWDTRRDVPDYKTPSRIANDVTTSRKRFLNESSKDWSLPLTSAFQFAESLTHGACGHPPIQLDLTSWNTLMKVCIYRGALWRANHLLRVEIPRRGFKPDIISYNTMLHGLARVGDATMLKDFLTEMTNIGIEMDKYTVQALVDGLLNASDISGAITIVQDLFNQHSVLPPYTSHLKIIEFALSNAMPYEAKRHVDFIQQLWKWHGSDKYHSKSFIELVQARQKNKHLSKESLQKLFDYYGYELKDKEFY